MTCGDAPELVNGFTNYSSTPVLVGDNLHYFCQQGFTLKGPSVVLCTEKGFSLNFPICEGNISRKSVLLLDNFL